MLVTADSMVGTIGGGHLEYRAIETARTQLAQGPCIVFRRFALGPSLGQCCGGVVDLLFEYEAAEGLGWIDVLARQLRAGSAVVMATAIDGKRHVRWVLSNQVAWPDGPASALIDSATRELAQQMLGTPGACPILTGEPPSTADRYGPRLLRVERVEPFDLDVVLFGAGHVGRALVGVLGGLPCRVTWVDHRDDEFGLAPSDNVILECTDTPEYEVDAAAPGACFLVMTHSHVLDFSLTARILARGDFRYFGLIGSLTKRRSFESRLRGQGVSVDTLTRITCPIGTDGVIGKEPSVIAVAVAAQLLQVREGRVRVDALANTRGKQRRTLTVAEGMRVRNEYVADPVN